MKQSVYIIAEAGVNHNGKIKIAKKLIKQAAMAKANAIKFQTFHAEKLTSKFAQKANYQKIDNTDNETQLSMLQKLELSQENHIELMIYAQECHIDFLSSPFDEESIDFLKTFNMPFWKIPSGEITNLPYLISIANTQRPVLLSTGMSTLDEIATAIQILKSNGSPHIELMHCNSAYPTPYEDVNLHAMQTLQKEFDCPVGYSDHTQGIEVAIAAVALGAVSIEKHFTLDQNMIGPDHRASASPDELKQLVQAIRNIELALGTANKQPSNSELVNRDIVRKSIVAKCPIVKGEVFSTKNITTKRPGSGLSPMEWFNILGKTALRDFEDDEFIEQNKF